MCCWPTQEAALTKYHRRGSLNNKKLFLTILETRSPRSRHQQGCCLARLSLWVADGLSSVPASKGSEREEASSLVSLIKTLIPSLGSHAQDLIRTYLPPSGPVSKYHHIVG